jgi:ribosomal protein S18 acetylase RimI-like enzyme
MFATVSANRRAFGGCGGLVALEDSHWMDVRQAALEDVPAIAALHSEGWTSFRTFLPETVWRPRTLERRLREWPPALRERDVLLAEEHDRVIGFISTRMAVTVGELSTFFVAPDARGRGVGTRLLAAGAGRLAGQGADWIVVRTFAEGRARVLFDRLGGQLINARMRDYGGAEIAEVTYRWPAGALERFQADDADESSGRDVVPARTRWNDPEIAVARRK